MGAFNRHNRALILQALVFAAFLLCATLPAHAQDTTSNLVGHWALDETVGTNASDETANGYDGTLFGNPTWQGTGGKIGGAMAFDGTDDRVMLDVATTTNLRINGDLTVAAWVKTSVSNASGAMVFLQDTSSVNNNYNLYLENGSPTFDHGNGAIGEKFTATATVNDDTWHHIAFVANFVDNTTNDGFFYIDGVLDSSVNLTFDIVKFNNNGYKISTDGSTYAFDGLMDDIRIYNRALTAADIAVLASSLTGPVTCNAAYEAVMWYNNDESVMQYCDGTNWIDMGPKETGGAGTCTAPTGAIGEVGYNNTEGQIQYCNGANWISMGPKTTTGGAPSAGLVGHWKLDESGNTSTAADTGGSNNGTLTGFPADPTANWVSGNVGGSLSFDGANDRVIVGDPAGGELDFGTTQSFTLSAWINTNNAASLTRPLSKGHWGWTGGGYGMWVDNGQLSAGTTGTSQATSTQTLTTNTVISNGNWYHVAAVFDQTAKTMELYVDGIAQDLTVGGTTCGTVTGTVLDYSACGTATASSAHDFVIGASHTNNEHFDGEVDDVRVYNRALSDAEIGSLFKATGGIGSVGPTGCSTIGDVCSDGSVYAGLSPDGNIAMYTTPADAGTYTWDDGLNNSLDTAIVNCGTTGPSCDTGAANTALLVALSGSGTPAPYVAAEYCDTLSVHGQTDWYLPARNELGLMYTNNVAIGGFNTSGVWYWSSTEWTQATARSIRFNDGGAAGTNKLSLQLVRCTRKGPGAITSDCSSPNGPAGEMIYNDDQNVMQYCNGSEWVGIR